MPLRTPGRRHHEPLVVPVRLYVETDVAHPLYCHVEHVFRKIAPTSQIKAALIRDQGVRIELMDAWLGTAFVFDFQAPPMEKCPKDKVELVVEVLVTLGCAW